VLAGLVAKASRSGVGGIALPEDRSVGVPWWRSLPVILLTAERLRFGSALPDDLARTLGQLRLAA